MLRIITKDKTEVVVWDYHKYQTLNCDSDGKETYEATYHLLLNKKDAQKFSVNEKVEDAFMGEDWKVKSISYLEKDLYCVELTRKSTKVKDDTQVTPEKDCKLDNACDCDCCSCEKEVKEPVKEDSKSVDSIDSLIKKALSQEDLDKLPKHLICVFSDGNKDTVAFEMENGSMKGVGIAKRHSQDAFNFHTGAELSFNRCVGGDTCICSGKGKGEVVWLHKGDDTPLLSATGKVLMLGDYVVGYKDGGYIPGVIGLKSKGVYYLCNESGAPIELTKFTDFDLVWRP